MCSGSAAALDPAEEVSVPSSSAGGFHHEWTLSCVKCPCESTDVNSRCLVLSLRGWRIHPTLLRSQGGPPPPGPPGRTLCALLGLSGRVLFLSVTLACFGGEATLASSQDRERSVLSFPFGKTHP